ATFLAQERVLRATRIADRIRELQPVLVLAAHDAIQRGIAARAGSPPVLALPATGRTVAAVALLRAGWLVAHEGPCRFPHDTGIQNLSLVRTPFNTAMVAPARSDDGRDYALAVVLLSSAAPADRFTQSLIQELPGPRGGAGVEVLAPLQTPTAEDNGDRLV